MGVAAMTLAGGEYAIHGTNVPNSIGGFVSYGCIRMLNEISAISTSASRSARPGRGFALIPILLIRIQKPR